MNNLSKRVMVFGPYVAACSYAREHELAPGQWCHGADRHRVMGLDPNQFETVIVGGHLDADSLAAVKEWEFVRRRPS